VKLAVPDLISPSYFPAVAAVELGCFEAEGLDVALELIFPVDACAKALHDDKIAFFAGSAHSVLAGFPDFHGAKLICAQSQGMYWFLVMRADLKAARGDLTVVKGRRIGAAPWVEMGLRRLLIASGIDPVRDDVTIQPVPGAIGEKANFGLMAAQALADGKIDGFWANGMGAEVAQRSGAGTLVLDIRRGDGPKECFNYTLASVAATDALIARSPATAAAAVRAIVATQRALAADLTLATKAGRALFPPREAELIADIVRRDLPYYDPSISRETVAGMNAFARDVGILDRDVPYEAVVAAGLTSSR